MQGRHGLVSPERTRYSDRARERRWAVLERLCRTLQAACFCCFPRIAGLGLSFAGFCGRRKGFTSRDRPGPFPFHLKDFQLSALKDTVLQIVGVSRAHHRDQRYDIVVAYMWVNSLSERDHALLQPVICGYWWRVAESHGIRFKIVPLKDCDGLPRGLLHHRDCLFMRLLYGFTVDFVE